MNTQSEPTIKSLLTASLSALVLAIVLLICFILPAEYNIDPTGIGRKLGLTVLAQTDTSSHTASTLSCLNNFLPLENDITIATNKPHVYQPKPSPWQDVVIINIPAKSGLEYKFHIDKDKTINYHWQSDGTPLYFDFHGEPDGDHSGYFKSYKETTLNQSNGRLNAPFNGKHGWYWENKSNKPVKILLQTSGEYSVLGLI